MNVEWFTNAKEMIVTIHDNNITLNTVASNYFKNVYSTIIGYNIDEKILLIKPLTKEEVDAQNLSADDLHSVSIKPSYGRINGKSIIKRLNNYYPFDFTKNKSYRYLCEWSHEEKLLKVYFTKEVK